MKKKVISNKEFLKLAREASKPVKFKSKAQVECYNAYGKTHHFPCGDCCCEYFESCNNIIEIMIENKE